MELNLLLEGLKPQLAHLLGPLKDSTTAEGDTSRLNSGNVVDRIPFNNIILDFISVAFFHDGIILICTCN